MLSLIVYCSLLLKRFPIFLRLQLFGHVFQIGGTNTNCSLHMYVSLLDNPLCLSEEVSMSRIELKLQRKILTV
jgi:hypothetical protein